MVKQELKEDNILKGKEMLQQYAKAKGYHLSEYTKSKYMEAVMRKYGFRDWDSVLAAIGHGGLKEGQVLNKLREAYEKEHVQQITDEQILDEVNSNQERERRSKTKSGIVVKGFTM